MVGYRVKLLSKGIATFWMIWICWQSKGISALSHAIYLKSLCRTFNLLRRETLVLENQIFTLHQYQILLLVLSENNKYFDISVETTPGVFYELSKEQEQWAVRGRRRNVDQVRSQAEDKCGDDLRLLIMT